MCPYVWALGRDLVKVERDPVASRCAREHTHCTYCIHSIGLAASAAHILRQCCVVLEAWDGASSDSEGVKVVSRCPLSVNMYFCTWFVPG